MDEIDILICQKLMQNARIPYREIASELKLTVAAIHNRIQNLQDAGIIKAFTANISLSYLDMVSVLLFGSSKADSMDEVARSLNKDSRTNALLVSTGNFIYVSGYLNHLSDLESYTDYIKNTCSLTSVTVAIEAFGPPGQTKPTRSEPKRRLSPLDLKIIDSLHWDARKRITDIAKEVGVSSKTVKRHLNSMIENQTIELVIQWHPDSSNDIIPFIHVNLMDGSDKFKVGMELMRTLGPRVVFFRQFSNIPNFIILVGWSNTMKEMKELIDELENREDVVSAIPYAIYTGYRFETFRDDIINTKII
ncbi:MAG: Lrp/AsnC family transcriptional regulator [Thermoplasmata archaeon]|nr:MAG: Lrp/AsnC family transcriptional regulator [Thermoplasmata archaeon]